MSFAFDQSFISKCLQAGAARGLLSNVDDNKVSAKDERNNAIPAAILIPLIPREDGISVLFTQRTAHLNDHPGQISFPGGRVEPQDSSMEDTALRETEEEIGLSRQSITVLGSLPEYTTRTGFRVTPIVGWVDPSFSITLDTFEVAEVFEVPLAFLLDPENHQQSYMTWEGAQHHYYAIPYQNRNIWGATAGMLRSLYMALVEAESL